MMVVPCNSLKLDSLQLMSTRIGDFRETQVPIKLARLASQFIKIDITRVVSEA